MRRLYSVSHNCLYIPILWLIFGLSNFSFAQECDFYESVFLDNSAPNCQTYPDIVIGVQIFNKKDSTFNSAATALQKKYIDKGYLGFSIDSISKENNVCRLFIHKGKRFKLQKIIVFPDEFSKNSKKYFFKPIYTPKMIELVDNKMLIEIKDIGYPFAILDKELIFHNNLITIKYQVKPSRKVYFDTIRTSPKNLISYNYLSKNTGIEAGEVFNIKSINNINRNINQEKLFKLDSVYTDITNDKASITLKLKKITQNSFSGIIGLQTDKDDKTEITGNVSISLANAFNHGERIKLEWQKFGFESQQLKTEFKIPYIFKLPVGISFYGDFDKQDTLFTNTFLKAGLLMPTVNYGELSINGKWDNSSVNTEHTQNINSTKGVLYGLGYSYSHIDNPMLMRKGIIFNSEIYLGNNTIINSDIDNSKTFVIEWLCNIEFALPLPVGSFYFRNKWAITKNDSIKINNLYRVGGVNTIRGFNERSIYTKAYSFANTEYHFYLNSESYIYLLYDIGIFKEPTNKQYNNTLKQAVGAGISISTKAGMLSISYAVGKNGSEQFLINKGQIHIGYINLF